MQPCPLLLATLILGTLLAGTASLCHRIECNCTPARTGGRASTCTFTKRQKLEMSALDFPEDLSTVEMTGGKELRLGAEIFSRLSLLDYVRISFMSKVFVMEHTFANMSSTRGVRFEFEDGQSLILEGRSWKNLNSHISVGISRFDQVIIQGQAFSWLYDLSVTQVNKLELLENAFFIERPKHNSDFRIRSIILDRVRLDTLAPGSFQSLASEVRLLNSHVERVRSDAFNAISLGHVVIENSTVHRLEKGAFSDRTVLLNLTLDRVTLHELESGAVLSGMTILNIRHSRLGTMHSGGFNVTVASVHINNNIFNRVHTKALLFKEWDVLSVNNNTFKKLDPQAFSSHELIKLTPPKINFTRNVLFDIPSYGFDFSVNEELDPFIDSNFFGMKCRCDITKLVTSMMVPRTLGESLYDTGLCAVDHILSKCFSIPEGFYSMSNFSELICPVSDKIILCEEVQRDAAAPPHMPSITSAVDIMFEDDVDRERRIVGSIFIIFLCAMIIMMVLSTFMWIGRNGYCTKARLLLLPSTNSFVSYLTRIFSRNGMTPTGSAHSISRISVHEYAELQRKIGETKEEEDETPLEDKATQTLPEELTQELLQSLQEKLNDPENYSEARNMIEHLYDLIKVEESCNKNYKDSTSINLEDLDKENENVYDVIVPKRKANGTKSKKEMVSTGTRAPSPDKLLPYGAVYGESKRLRPGVSDYMEPRDQQVHTYTELPPAVAPVTVMCVYGEPTDTRVHTYTELPGAHLSMANRPLPSKPPGQPPTL